MDAVGAIALPVEIIFFEQSIGCEACTPTRQLVEQIAGSDDRISLEVLNLVLDKTRAEASHIDRVPAIIVSSAGRPAMRFLGAPFGNELTSLVGAIRMAGTGDSGLSERSRDALKGLSGPADIKVFFTPTCVYCPRMVMLANQIAVETAFVTATAIEATEYPDLVQRYNVNGVPKTVINDKVEILGAVTEEQLVEKLLEIG